MLTLEGCRARQGRFLARLEEAGITTALISDSRDIYYFTGLLPEVAVTRYPSLLCLGPGLDSWLVTGAAEGEAWVDERVVYPISEMATLNPDNHRRAAEEVARCAQDLAPPRAGRERVGYQREALPFSLQLAYRSAYGEAEWVEVDGIVQDLQLRKDEDEVACIRRSIAATLAAYDRAQELIRPGISELEVMTECQAAAQRYSGSVHFYNGDFRSGELGGFARNRSIEQGELYIIDAWTDLGGYWCDMARTWSVGGTPSDLQLSVYEHVSSLLQGVPELARPGRSTREFWAELDARIREHPHLAADGLIHHGGHGIGLRAHEGPDLNRDRGGTFEVGTVFTCEPGGYSSTLRGGVRLENLFLVTADGTKVLSDYPLNLVAGSRPARSDAETLD